jgi:hypothetical protein
VAYEVSIDTKTRTIAIRGTGSGTTADTLELIQSQLETFRDHPGFNLLYDSSGLDIESSSSDMLKVAEALFQKGAAHFGRIAVVVPERRMDLARIFAALAQTYGINANVFTHPGDAHHWLGID